MFKKILVVPCVAIGVASLLGVSSARAADEETKVSGRIFADFTDITAKNAADVKTAQSGYGLDVTRAYIALDHKFDDIWSANITTDFQYSSAVGATELFIKKAYVQAKLSDAVVIRAGDTDTPWVPFVEGLYGYRFVEKVIVDRLKFGGSADYALNASGKTQFVNYSASLENGNGYKAPGRSKGVDVEGRVGVTPINGLTVGIGFYSGKRGLETEVTDQPNTASRFDGLVGYTTGGLKVGVEYFSAKNWAVTTENKADGFSGWASYDFTPMWGVFARADQAKPAKTTAPDRKDKYFNLGVVSHPRKNIDIALVYKNDKDPGGVSTSGTFGTGAAPAAPAKYSEVGVFGQVSF